MYDMQSTNIRQEETKEKYVADLTNFFKGLQVWTHPTEVVSSLGRVGITKTIVFLRLGEYTRAGCLQFSWIFENNNWFMNGDGGNCDVPSDAFQ
ncbi:MAG: hypothetical protein G01um101448_67 [Parcubacteria group bacterium Gr01-1014_48]|nr:MAG: hypothetical protein Greene041614_149 [Parcubacteria group bacterium Greene0416_14]TSC74548.1 MAG: hypothetical protein G01um101448_67 [Parcubacteria group bacterium Gr01-1014_48]TSD01424.1 MAG: hypothetical protein Greene101415_271 [Parcubacteria group bacterium Greene1014_15]TSD08434.1 MAG: hypothetical protein Greene07144_64 [Parcubacteria group bacterium Greene0714_4]